MSTLTRITSKVSKVEDVPFLKRVLDTTEKKQKYCVLLHDEVYVKKMLLYHGGTVFGKAQNHPSKLAETVLGIMIICLHEGPSFISKIVPVSNLDANYLHDQVFHRKQILSRLGESLKLLFVTETEQIRHTSESMLHFLINLGSQKTVLI